MKACGYIRVSTADQALNGIGLASQRERIEAWCMANGYALVQTFSDEGASGKRADNRIGLQNALQAACEARGAALIVYSLSRLARSTKDAISIAERLDKAGADLVSLSERIDTTTAAGKMVFRMLAVLAEFERDLVSERTTAALAHKKAIGQRVGSVPYGYELAPDGSTLAPLKSELAVIDDICSMRVSGLSLERIAAALTERGTPTKTGRSTRWTHQAVARIVNRPTERR
jgi:site-specific DNA recombinase